MFRNGCSCACAFLFRGAYGNRLRVTTEGEAIAEGESAVDGHRLSLRVRVLKAYLPAAAKNGMPRAPHHKLFMHIVNVMFPPD